MYRIYLRLGRLLGDLNITKQDLADLTGINPNKIGNLVNGLSERVSLVDLSRICEVLEVEITDILDLVKTDSVSPAEERLERIHRKVQDVREDRTAMYAERRRIAEEEAKAKKVWLSSQAKSKYKR